jgi:hypothetical protein
MHGTKEKALAAMNTTSRVNGIFNKDLAVQLVLIANNDAVVYLDAATDPYSAAAQRRSWCLESGGSDYLNECDWGGDMVICLVLLVELKCWMHRLRVFHLLP